MTHTNGVNSLGTVAALSTATDKKTDAVRPQQVVQPARVDQASLSIAGGLAAQGGTDVRWSKVQALQEAIGNGTYQVSAHDVASKMVDALLE